MNEIRKDYILDRYVIIATDRAKRPAQFIKQKQKTTKETCFFCPGNEHLTPPEIDRIEKNNKWLIRCFPNKFAATTIKGNPKIKIKGAQNTPTSYRMSRRLQRGSKGPQESPRGAPERKIHEKQLVL